MQAYLYHQETKEYIGPTELFIDPLETMKKGKNVYLMPSNATLKKPGEIPEKYVARWTGNKWEILEDHRNDRASGMGGTPYWTNEDHYYSVPRVMRELGPLPDGALLSSPAMTVEEAQEVSERQYNDAQTQLILQMVPVIAEQLLGVQPTTLEAELAISSLEESTSDTAKVVNPLEALLANYNRNKVVLQQIKESDDVETIKSTKYIS